jgi:hypothetical protein
MPAMSYRRAWLLSIGYGCLCGLATVMFAAAFAAVTQVDVPLGPAMRD